MRWLFLLLLILNVSYVTWELNRERSQQTVHAVLPKGVERLVLLSEMNTESSHDKAVAEAQTEAFEQEAEAQAEALEQDAAAATEDVAGMPQQQESSTKTDLQAAEVADMDDSATVTSGISVDDVHQEASVDTATEAPVEKPTEDLCYTVGPFREMKTLRLVTRAIKDYVIEASFRSREEQEQSMFRVYLKPVGSKREAKALIKQLVSKNIRDYFIITDGPNKNGISLGYFSDKSRAQGHADRIRKLGFDVILEPVFRSYTIYWLDYRIKSGNEIPQQVFEQHLDNTTQQLSRSCV